MVFSRKRFPDCPMCVFFPVGKAYIGFFVFKVFIFQEKSIFFSFFFRKILKYFSFQYIMEDNHV